MVGDSITSALIDCVNTYYFPVPFLDESSPTIHTRWVLPRKLIDRETLMKWLIQHYREEMEKWIIHINFLMLTFWFYAFKSSEAEDRSFITHLEIQLTKGEM